MRPVALMVGRLNPITRGHEALYEQLMFQAELHGMRPVVFIVDGFKSGKDASQNPLTAEQRKTIAKKAFPGAYVDVVSNAYEVIDVLQVQGYKPGVWIAGSDRVQGYKKLLKSANSDGVVIEVDRDAGEAKGVSATKARDAAREGNLALFGSYMPKSFDRQLIADLMMQICSQIGDGDGTTNKRKGGRTSG